eukprot:TRINITY_DN1851_c0_g2_i9.p1 TRINITY_DN1851_c0_g2~~TRINITY_DN1851_c0_g2_i9.p1  ORF type:complete len:124 (-),score=9.92 TRINITY_DN1851_c0_g2_i9:175-546(-)
MFLPDEVVAEILSNCDFLILSCTCLVSTKWREVTRSRIVYDGAWDVTVNSLRYKSGSDADYRIRLLQLGSVRGIFSSSSRESIRRRLRSELLQYFLVEGSFISPFDFLIQFVKVCSVFQKIIT